MRIFVWLTAIAVCFNAYSVNVEVEAGGLEAELSGQSPETVTSLAVDGTVDVRDFLFIAGSMPALKQLDLSGARIAAYSDREPVVENTYSFEADVVPDRIFAGTGIETVVLPAVPTEIGEGAFAGCRGLKEVDMSNSVSVIGAMAFAGADKMASLVGTEAVEQIDDYAFSRCHALGKAVFPKLKTIGKYSFQSCATLGQFAFSEELTSVGEGAFKYSGLVEADLSGCGRLAEVGSWAFSDMPNLERASFPALVKVDEGMFFDSSDLRNVELATTVTTLGDFSLSGTAVADENVIPSQVAEIGDYALSDSKGLQRLVIPASVEYIGEGAMRNCTSLMSLESKAVVPPALGDDVWANVDKSAIELTVPEMSYSQYKSALQWQDFFNATSDVNEIGKDPVLSMDGGVLRIAAVKPLNSVRIYDLKGMPVVSADNVGQTAEYDLNGNVERVYTVVCEYRDGSVEVFKVGKK